MIFQRHSYCRYGMHVVGLTFRIARVPSVTLVAGGFISLYSGKSGKNDIPPELPAQEEAAT